MDMPDVAACVPNEQLTTSNVGVTPTRFPRLSSIVCPSVRLRIFQFKNIAEALRHLRGLSKDLICKLLTRNLALIENS